MAEIVLLADRAALACAGDDAVTALTEAATRSTFYQDGMTATELDAIRRVVAISAPCMRAAAESDTQYCVAAFVDGGFAGYVIAARHAPDDLELDWLMVDPACHGSGVAARLMQAGMDWLGTDRPIWLNVKAHNARAVAFYRRFGFAIDPDARTNHVIVHHVMRRPGVA